MQVHATADYSAAIIIDGDSISRLWKHVADFTPEVSAIAYCTDGIEREFTNLGELLNYENPIRAAVRIIKIFGKAPSRTISVTVGYRYSPHAQLSLQGEEVDVTAMRTRILDSFSGMRAWYSPVATLDLVAFWCVIFGAIMVIIQFMSQGHVPNRSVLTFSEAVQALGLVVLYLAPVFAIVFVISRFKARYFPTVSVALGQGVRRHNTDEKIRWTIFVGLLVSLTASAIYAWVSGT